MDFDWRAPTPLSYFSLLVQSDGDFPLLEAAVSLAQDERPQTDVHQVLFDVDTLARRLARRVDKNADALIRLRELGQFFFGELGFSGNVNDYYDPANSFLDQVIHTRRGIPVSLAVLWIELARSIDLHAEGVDFPGHFLVQVPLGDGRAVIDPFTGQSLSREDLLERLAEFAPKSAAGSRPDIQLAMVLQPATERRIIGRMLGNLQHIYRNQSDWTRLLDVQNRLIILEPDAWTEYRNRGLALAQVGQHQQARADLAVYLEHAEDAYDRAAIEARLMELRGTPK